MLLKISLDSIGLILSPMIHVYHVRRKHESLMILFHERNIQSQDYVRLVRTMYLEYKYIEGKKL